MACQWRSVCASLEEVVACWSSTRAGWHLRWRVARRHLGRCQHLAKGIKHDPHGRADPQQWLNSALLQLAQGRLHVVQRLISIGRHVAAGMDRRARTADAQSWASWLRGEQPATNAQVHRRAFSFVRGHVGWMRSSLRNGTALPDALTEEEAETSDCLPLGQDQSCAAGLWTPRTARGSDWSQACTHQR